MLISSYIIAQVYLLFEFSVLGYIFSCALPAGVVALIKDIKG